LQFVHKHYGAQGCGFLRRQAALARIYKQQAENLKARGLAYGALQNSLHALALYPLGIDYYRTAGSLLLNWIGSSKPLSQ
jgi:hypothetical protein